MNINKKTKTGLTPLLSGLLLAGSAVVTMEAQALSITNGSLYLDISTTTGAIDTLTYGGSDWYNPGTPVSDWGLQSSTDTTSFAINTTTGGAGVPVSSVTESGGTITVSAAYTAASGDVINIDRSYTIIAGYDAVLVSTTLSTGIFNTPGDIRLFETFDPDMGIDQGVGFGTFMDITTLGGFDVAEAWITGPDLAVVMGTADVLASGGPFQISTGTALNSVFDAPVDANGAFVDQGMHLGFETNLDAPSSSATFAYIMAYGTTLADAEGEFMGAAGIVPIPAAVWLFGSGLIGLIGIARRRA